MGVGDFQGSKVRNSLDRANPNGLSDLLRKIGFGQLLQGQVAQLRRGVDMDALGADPNELATLDVLRLPDEGRAATILRAFARTGTAGTGEMTVAAPGATPATGEIAVSPSGNIVTLAADAITDVDVSYMPERGDSFEGTFDVASDVLTIPTSITGRKVVSLLDVEATEGTATGRKVILVPGAGAPAAGQARLNVAKTTVTFAGADAVTRARVVLLLGSAVETTETLETEAETS